MSLKDKKNIDPKVERIVEILINDFPEGVTLSNISEMVTYAMKIVGKYPKMDGYQKKQLVIDAIQALADEHDAGKFNDQIDAVVKFVVPKLIDHLILVEKDKLKFNKQAFSWLNCCKST